MAGRDGTRVRGRRPGEGAAETRRPDGGAGLPTKGGGSSSRCEAAVTQRTTQRTSLQPLWRLIKLGNRDAVPGRHRGFSRSGRD